MFYRVDANRLSFREYWRWRPGIPFLFLAVQKILGIRRSTGQRYERPETLVSIDAHDLPDRHRSVLDPLTAQASSLGFALQFYYSVPSVGRIRGVAAALTSTDRLSLLLLIHSTPKNALRPAQPAYALYSCAADGRILATSGGLPGLISAAPEIHVLRIRHGSLDETWQRHSTRTSGESLVPFRAEAVADWLLRLLQRNFDYNVGRGVYVPCPEYDSHY